MLCIILDLFLLNKDNELSEKATERNYRKFQAALTPHLLLLYY